MYKLVAEWSVWYFLLSAIVGAAAVFAILAQLAASAVRYAIWKWSTIATAGKNWAEYCRNRREYELWKSRKDEE